MAGVVEAGQAVPATENRPRLVTQGGIGPFYLKGLMTFGMQLLAQAVAMAA